MRKAILLKKLYQEVANCRACGGQVEGRKAPKKVGGVNPSSDLMIVSQSLGPRTERETGVSYFNVQGRLGLSGKSLEEFLNELGYTLHPPRTVKLESGRHVQRRDEGLETAYSTDVIKCYAPNPTIKLARKCLERNFLAREIKIVRPVLVLLAGKISCKCVYSKIGSRMGTLGEEIGCLLGGGEAKKFEGVTAVPIYHPSPQNYRFRRKMLEKNDMIGHIRKLLQQ